MKKILITLLSALSFQFPAYSYTETYNLDNTFKSKINSLIPEEKVEENINKISIQKKDFNPILAGWLATVFPGAGYYYLEEYNRALISAPLIFPLVIPDYITTETFQSKSFKTQSIYISNYITGFTVYDTYQTALDKIDRPDQVLSIPHYSLKELYLAPFDSRAYISKKWESNLFRFGLLGLNALIRSMDISQKGINKNLSTERIIGTIPLILAFSFLVGMGEEVYFRGFIQPSFSEISKSKLVGNLAQATNFGLAHTYFFTNTGLNSFPYGISTLTGLTSTIDKNREFFIPATSNDPASKNNDFANFARAGLFGFLFGLSLEADEKDDGLLKTIAFHSLFDFIGMTSDFLTEGSTGRLYLNFSLPLKF